MLGQLHISFSEKHFFLLTFYFRTVLHLHNYSEASTEFPYTLYIHSPIINILHLYGVFAAIHKPIVVYYTNRSSYLIQIVSVSP